MVEIDVRAEIDEFRFADGEPGENNVCVYDGYLVINGDGRQEVEIHAEDIDNLIEALRRARENISDGPDYPDGPWADGWETRITGKEEARDIAYVSMTVNARDFEEIPPVKYRQGSSWILHNGGECPVHPLDIVEIINDLGGKGVGALPAEKFLWAGVDYYRHKKDEDGVPYVSNEGLEPWAEYVATDRFGDVWQFKISPVFYNSIGGWSPGLVHLGKGDMAPKQYKNTIQHWTETLRRVWRK